MRLRSIGLIVTLALGILVAPLAAGSGAAATAGGGAVGRGGAMIATGGGPVIK